LRYRHREQVPGELDRSSSVPGGPPFELPITRIRRKVDREIFRKAVHGGPPAAADRLVRAVAAAARKVCTETAEKLLQATQVPWRSPGKEPPPNGCRCSRRCLFPQRRTVSSHPTIRCPLARGCP